MKPQDKLEIVANLRQNGFDMTKAMLAPMVAEVERYVSRKNLEQKDEIPSNAVIRFDVDSGKQPVAILNDGRKIKVSLNTYRSERLYNLVPTSYKTMIL